MTKEQLNLWGVKYHLIKVGKPEYDYFICDKTINWYDNKQLVQQNYIVFKNITNNIYINGNFKRIY